MDLELPEALGLLINALLLDVSLIYGFRRGVPYFRHYRSLADRHAILVDQLNQEMALGVAHVRILLLYHVVDIFTIGCVISWVFLDCQILNLIIYKSKKVYQDL